MMSNSNESNRIYCNAEVMRAIVKKMKANEKKPLSDKIIVYALAESFVKNERDLHALQDQHKATKAELEYLEKRLSDRTEKDEVLRHAITKEIDNMTQEEFDRWSKVILGEHRDMMFTIDN